MLLQAYAGDWRTRDIWSRASDHMPYRWIQPNPTLDNTAPAAGAEDSRGAVCMAPLNEAAVGSATSALIKSRWSQMKEFLFEPCTGPLKDMDGNTTLQAGERITHDGLWNMLWFVENIQNRISE